MPNWHTKINKPTEHACALKRILDEHLKDADQEGNNQFTS